MRSSCFRFRRNLLHVRIAGVFRASRFLRRVCKCGGVNATRTGARTGANGISRYARKRSLDDSCWWSFTDEYYFFSFYLFLLLFPRLFNVCPLLLRRSYPDSIIRLRNKRALLVAPSGANIINNRDTTVLSSSWIHSW